MRLSHDEYFLEMLRLVAARSTCSRRQVGAIIVSADNHILSTGYNGVPKGLAHCVESPCLGRYDVPGDTVRCLAVHAEQNALLQCQRLDLASTMYVSCSPCFICAKMICNTPIKRIVVLEEYADDRYVELFRALGIKLTVYKAQQLG